MRVNPDAYVIDDGDVVHLATGRKASLTAIGMALIERIVHAGLFRVNENAPNVIIWDGNANEVMGELVARAITGSLADGQ